VIKLDGEEIFHKEGLRTRTQIGFADSVELDIEQEEVLIEISLPSRKLTESISLSVSKPVFLGVSLSLEEDRIEYVISNEPFGYL
jgi:hypothetical protein